MGIISTKELIDSYYNSEEGAPFVKTRANIDKLSLYKYEIKIGKELIDMNVEELYGLIEAMSNNGKEDDIVRSHYSYEHLLAILRKLFGYYNNTYQPIKNPFYDKRMKGKEIVKYLSKGKEKITFNFVQSIIDRLHEDLVPIRADYVELIMLMFYSGFANADEIVLLKEKDINFKHKIAYVSGRTIKFTDRCFELLTKFRKIVDIDDSNRFTLCSYRDGYFKFSVRNRQIDQFDNRELNSVRDIISRCMHNNVFTKYGIKINYRTLYCLGFYDNLVKQYGKNKVEQMVMSFRNSDDVGVLINEAGKWGLPNTNVTHLKRILQPFLDELD